MVNMVAVVSVWMRKSLLLVLLLLFAFWDDMTESFVDISK